MECPVCSEEIPEEITTQYADGEILDCPDCGTELYIEDNKLYEQEYGEDEDDGEYDSGL